ncbi:cation-transporting P-type ATPase [Salegentibacter mishustinae]|uniref:cation-translocating P-type ATPase n=1 Tax=Salegentibacter mishustinae TaxID=270918 RepID=UPI001CE0989A|nr:cation-transporting P-type ATPase [Salegentibacter mishustinae]UBZ07491.1 cation-transporting P-type ATPase [Salegentibacter mishustinae]
MSKDLHTLSVEKILSEFNVDANKGLTASEVKLRLEKHGYNRLKKRKSKNIGLIFLEQFLDPIIYILAAAMAFAYFFGEWLEGTAVLIVILITALIGFFMEWQALRSVEALQKMVETQANVLRGGKEEQIKAAGLVPGDIVILESGDVIPADCRMLETESFAVKEAILTGESNQIEKSIEKISGQVALADRKNMLYKGTIAVRGNAKAIVVATGLKTEIGRISELTSSAEKESTPLEKKLKRLSRWLIWLTLILALLIIVTGYFQGKDLMLMIETGIALAVAAIPEGLPIVATIALARGMLRLSKRNVIIKKLEAVQTLGETGIICTDKTGTLTENKMSVHHLVFGSSEFPATEAENFKKDPAFERLIDIGCLCNNSKMKNGEMAGDAVEIALVEFAAEMGFDCKGIQQKYPRSKEIPFDAEIKKMATLNRVEDNFLVCVKGALEALLESCDLVLTKEGPKEFQDKKRWERQAKLIAAEGMRVLAFAYKESKEEPEKESLMDNLTFVGILGFLDPPRKDIKQAIETYKNAGIRVVMITGDHPDTARKIGEEVGLITEDAPVEVVIKGSELENIKTITEDRQKTLMEAGIFARMVPGQKLDLVEFYQKNKAIVGMLGDGVNDAPALKKADIGIAMGIRGTEAAKEVADVILMDDKFTSTELAIRQGRTIFENIRQFVIFLLSCNLAEIISVALASLSNLPMPLLPLQILFLNLITDVFPALALGVGKGDPNIMKDPPRDPQEPILTKKLWRATVLYGLSITAAVIGVVAYTHFEMGLSAILVNNIAFYTLILAQLLNVFNLPRRKISFLKNEVTTNPWVWAASAFSILVMVIVYHIPVMAEALSLVPLSANHLLVIIVFGVASLVISQILKHLKLTN